MNHSDLTHFRNLSPIELATIAPFLELSDKLNVSREQLEERCIEVEQDIELGRGNVAADAAAHVSGDLLIAAWPDIAQDLMEQSEDEDTPIEKRLRSMLKDAIKSYCMMMIVTENKSAVRECEAEREWSHA